MPKITGFIGLCFYMVTLSSFASEQYIDGVGIFSFQPCPSWDNGNVENAENLEQQVDSDSLLPPQVNRDLMYTIPFRPDIIQFVHTNLVRNLRRPFQYDRSSNSWEVVQKRDAEYEELRQRLEGKSGQPCRNGARAQKAQQKYLKKQQQKKIRHMRAKMPSKYGQTRKR